MTTQDIIQFLPFEEEFKKSMLADFANLTPDQRFQVEQIVWDAYTTLYTMRLETNIDEALLNVADQKDHLDADFYKRIQEKTKLEMQSQMAQTETTVDLSSTREQLEALIKQSN